MTATSLDLSQIKTDALSSAATFRTLIGLGSNDAVLFNGVSIKGSGITSFAPRLRELTFGMLTIDRADGQAFSVTLGNAGTSANRGIYISAAYELAFTSINNPQNGQYKDVIIRRDTADTLAQSRDTNAQTFRLYNTYTSSTSFERLNVRWATNELIIDAEAGSGGGTLRGIKLGSATTSLLGFYGVTPVDQPLTVADPAGGGTVDSEARTAIGEIIDRLQELGLIA